MEPNSGVCPIPSVSNMTIILIFFPVVNLTENGFSDINFLYDLEILAIQHCILPDYENFSLQF